MKKNTYVRTICPFFRTEWGIPKRVEYVKSADGFYEEDGIVIVDGKEMPRKEYEELKEKYYLLEFNKRDK